jgi:predicted nuclease of predicted toxin-antitoxin system
MALTFRFLFDECLSPELESFAHNLGFDAYHVKHLGKLGASDRAVSLYAIENDLIVVTNNRADYVRIYRLFDLHPGLIIIIPNVAIPAQEDLFDAVLSRLPELGDLTNKLVEVDREGEVTIADWPPLAANDPVP